MKTAVAAAFAFAAVTGMVASAQQAAPAAPPAGESPYRIAGRLPVRIMSFAVEPTSIQPGQTVTLTWATENPTSISIDPIGRVAPRGRQTLSPTVTTTYTLSVTGASSSAEKRTVTVVVQGTMAGASPADASAVRKTVPRTADGKPDLSGVYGYGAGPGGRGGDGTEVRVVVLLEIGPALLVLLEQAARPTSATHNATRRPRMR